MERKWLMEWERSGNERNGNGKGTGRNGKNYSNYENNKSGINLYLK